MKNCVDCSADISHKRSNAKRCEECAYKIKIERNRLRHHRDPEYRRQQRERLREWRQQNPERVKQQQKRGRQKPEYKEKAKQRKRTPEYKEKEKQRKQTSEYKEYNRQYNQRPEVKEKKRLHEQAPKYKEKKRQYNQQYYQRPENKEKQKQYLQQYKQRPEVKAKARERYHRVGGTRLRRSWPDLLLRDGPICGICNEPLNPIREDFHIDHIVPTAHGGTNDLSNLQLAHPHCNMSKSDTWDGTAPSEPPAQLPLFA